jgi:hypothetical protein
MLKSELYNELRAELATKEFVRAEIGEVRAELKQKQFAAKNIDRDCRFRVDVI